MKKKCDTLEELFKEIDTQAFRDKALKRRKDYKESLTAEYQLGYYVGEDIINRFLPTTSVDMIQTKRRIATTIAEYDEHKRLDDIWYKSKDSKDWDRLLAEYKRLTKKYLPETLECHMRSLNISNPDEFKEGLINSLWNSDVCHYSLDPEKITIEDVDELYFTLIKFELEV